MKLNFYQEQPYLLDPYIEQLLSPVVEKLRLHASAIVSRPGTSVSGSRLQRLTQILYTYIKFRGYKTISWFCFASVIFWIRLINRAARFFPHEIADLSIALGYILLPLDILHERDQWPLRYVVLLWLSLICLIPFDLAQFDEPGRLGETAGKIENLAKAHLDKAGLERQGASILLARFYMR